jgi:hypothetical protein
MHLTQYRRHIINDPVVWLTKDKEQLMLGSKAEADKEGWIALAEERKNYPSEEAFAQSIAAITMLTTQELSKMTFVQS